MQQQQRCNSSIDATAAEKQQQQRCNSSRDATAAEMQHQQRSKQQQRCNSSREATTAEMQQQQGRYIKIIRTAIVPGWIQLITAHLSFAHSLITHSLISLKSNERLWAIRWSLLADILLSSVCMLVYLSVSSWSLLADILLSSVCMLGLLELPVWKCASLYTRIILSVLQF